MINTNKENFLNKSDCKVQNKTLFNCLINICSDEQLNICYPKIKEYKMYTRYTLITIVLSITILSLIKLKTW